MNSNFFKQVEQIAFTGSLHIIITKGENNTLTVSTIPRSEQCGDKAKNLITPLNLTGTAQEFDEGYFKKITEPVQTASGLMDNMQLFMQQLQEAQKQSVMEKQKTDKQRKEKETKEKQYKEAMQQVDELEKAGKYRDAWTKVPDPAQFPEQAEALRKRKSSLSAKFAPELFGTAPASDETQQPPTTGEQAAAEQDTDVLPEDLQDDSGDMQEEIDEMYNDDEEEDEQDNDYQENDY